MRFLILLIMFGCSSKMKNMRGNEASLLEGDKVIRVTAEADEDLSLEDYRFLNIYFSNDSSDWIRLKSVIVKEVQGHPDFHVIRGSDFIAWKRSMLLDDEIRREILKKEKKPLPALSLRKKLKELDPSLCAEGSYSLPGNLQTERWLVLQIPGAPTSGTLVLELKFADDSSSLYQIKFPKGTP